MRLERNSLLDHWQQPLLSQPAIAELYHENSKLFEGLAGELLASRVDAESLRNVVAVRRAQALRSGSWPPAELPQQVSRLVNAALSELPLSALYAFDLRILSGGALAVIEPASKAAYVLKTVAPPDIAAMHDALALVGRRRPHSPDGVLVFLVASFARNRMLYGSRGYRRTLLEGGRLVEHMLAHAAAAGFAGTVWLEFADRLIDAFVEADGIEEATIAVLDMRSSQDADDS